MKKRIVAGIMALLCASVFCISACEERDYTGTLPEASINANGELIFTYPDGREINVGVVKGADGKDGVNGMNGMNGADGKDGMNGADGKDGVNGIDGKDGLGIVNAEISNKGELIITYTDGTSKNLGVVKGKDGKDGSKITIGENGHFYIDGEDTFYVAGERDVIKISNDGKKYTEGMKEPLTIRKVPATDRVLEESRLNVISSSYAENGELLFRAFETNKVEDLYALFDLCARDGTSPYCGIFLATDTSKYSFLNTTHYVYQTTDSEYNKYPNTFRVVSTISRGVIEMEDGRQYNFRIQSNHDLAEDFYFIEGIDLGADDLARYVCYDKEAFLTESYIEQANLYLGRKVDYSSRSFGIGYKSSNENNPHKEAVEHWMNEYYYSSFLIRVFDYNDPNGKLTEEEFDLVCGQLIDVIKDCFVVYDYDYYMDQVNNGK